MRFRYLFAGTISLIPVPRAGAQTITNLTLNPTTITGGNTSTGTAV